MYKLIFAIIFLPYLTTHILDRDIDDDEQSGNTEKKLIGAQQIRCTRRFSPGVCLEEVKPVWTYNFHLQNCTERLGCRQSSVSNRFMTYQHCMLSCQSLVQIYNHILAQETEINDTQWSQERGHVLRQYKEQAGTEMTTEDDETTTFDFDDPYVQNLQVEREDLDKIQLAEVLPEDLDYMAPDFAHFDPIHRRIRF